MSMEKVRMKSPQAQQGIVAAVCLLMCWEVVSMLKMTLIGLYLRYEDRLRAECRTRILHRQSIAAGGVRVRLGLRKARHSSGRILVSCSPLDGERALSGKGR